MLRVFEAVRSLEPAGIGAVDLRDCLLLQLGRRDADDDTATACRIVTDFFDLYSKRHFDRLQTALGVDKDTLTRADELTRGLNPKPASLGSDRAGERTRHVSPDFTVDYDPTSDSFNLGLTGQVPELGGGGVVQQRRHHRPHGRGLRQGQTRRRHHSFNWCDAHPHPHGHTPRRGGPAEGFSSPMATRPTSAR